MLEIKASIPSESTPTDKHSDFYNVLNTCYQKALANMHLNPKNRVTVPDFYLFQKALDERKPDAVFLMAHDCWRNEDFNKAYFWFQQLAIKGHPQAQFCLAFCYQEGKGVKCNFTEALKFYRQAAEQGVAEAQMKLAECYEKGIGVKPDLKEMVKFLELAVAQWNRKARAQLVKLASCYENGLGVKKNLEKAFRLFNLAAIGNPQAQFELARAHKRHFPQDHKQHFQLYKSAAEQGHTEAQFEIAYAFEWGYGVENNFWKAVDFYKQAAAKGHVEATYHLALCYQEGLGVEQNWHKVKKYLSQAAMLGHAIAAPKAPLLIKLRVFQAVLSKAEQGDSYAQFQMGRWFGNGKLVEKDQKMAFKWMYLAAQQGEPGARAAIEAKPRITEEIKVLKDKAKTGDNQAQLRLAREYAKGTGFDKDIETAKTFYQAVASQGNARAQYKLAKIYKEEGNNEEALKLYEAAAKAGHTLARDQLIKVIKSDHAPEDAKEVVRIYQGMVNSYPDHLESVLGLALCYDTGKGVNQDIKKAVQLYQQVMDTTGEYQCEVCEEAEARLIYWANCYYHGEGGVASDKNYAFQLYKYLADSLGCKEASVLLAAIYEQGEPGLVEKDLPLALKLYQYAADEFEDESAQKIVAQWHLAYPESQTTTLDIQPQPALPSSASSCSSQSASGPAVSSPAALTIAAPAASPASSSPPVSRPAASSVLTAAAPAASPNPKSPKWFGLPLNATIGKDMKLPPPPPIKYDKDDDNLTCREKKRDTPESLSSTTVARFFSAGPSSQSNQQESAPKPRVKKRKGNFTSAM